MAKRVGLRTEIIVSLALLLGAALLFAGFLLLKLTERELVTQRISSIVTTMEIVSKVLTADLGKSPDSHGVVSRRLRDAFKPLLSLAVLNSWRLLDKELSPVMAFQEDKLPLKSEADGRRARLTGDVQVATSYRSGWLTPGGEDGGAVVVTVPLWQRGEFYGVVQARVLLNDVKERIASARQLVLLYAAMYGAVLIVAGIYLLNRNVVRPIGRLREMTQEVASGNLEKTVPVDGAREIAELAESFNAMTWALNHSRQETRSHIDSLQQANQELRQTQNELVRSEKMASVGHLAAGMAHEIGNPLGATVGYLEFLKAGLESEGQRDIAQRALAELERIDRLVRELLDYAAPSSNEPENLDLLAAAAGAADFLRHQGVFDHHRLQCDLPQALPAVSASRDRLQQVLVNLLLNARDATDAGGTITLDAGTRDNRVWLGVSDTGCGMNSDVVSHIFDPFYTTKPPGRGRGLGLAICQRIIEEAGGRIDVWSEEGMGSEFKLSLPIAES